MFIYLVLRDPRNRPIYIDKYICKNSCDVCLIRFRCYTRKWITLRSLGDLGAIFNRDEVTHDEKVWINGFGYCCRLVANSFDDIVLAANGI